MSGNMVQGSEEWFRTIAEVLRDQLLGMELDIYPGGNVLPPCQVGYIILWRQSGYSEFNDILNIPGYRGIYPGNKGNDKRVAMFLFDFYQPLPWPSKELLQEVAADYGLTRPIEKVWGENHYGFYSPKLFE